MTNNREDIFMELRRNQPYRLQTAIVAGVSNSHKEQINDQDDRDPSSPRKQYRRPCTKQNMRLQQMQERVCFKQQNMKGRKNCTVPTRIERDDITMRMSSSNLNCSQNMS
ncbi:hypothetical protein Ocin01_18961 [Orchesella cincta]|uniref:Uncharacterized protein n=1 Tax=Orchesella cincta TaxID=48709 RepID=A0A1D2M422_ORCCI|nr:hypothetical protein Ocin01_18961 [Orchesella cincta]